MKKVKVKYNYLKGGEHPESEGILFESSSDVEKFINIQDKISNNIARKFVTSNEPYTRYDHVISGLNPLEKGIEVIACVNTSLNEN